MGHCCTCRFWSAWDDLVEDDERPLVGTCTAIISRTPRPDDDDEPPEPDPTQAHVTIGGYVSTGAYFGCMKFERDTG